MSWEDRYWDSDDGLRLHYRDYARQEAGQASGAAIICLPGLSRNCRDFETLAPLLASVARVVAPSLRGRGLSQYANDADTYVPEVYVRDLLRLIDSLACDSLVVIGTSLGARLAMMLAHVRPNLFGGAVLNDLGPETPASALTNIRSGLADRPSRWPDRAAAAASLAAAHAASFPDYADRDWDILVDRTCRTETDGSVALDYDPSVSATYRRAAAPAAAYMWEGFDLLAKAPVLSIRGELSPMLTPELQQQMRQRATAPFFAATVPRVAHAPTLDEPESIAVIMGFLAGIWPDSPARGAAVAAGSA